MHNSFVQLLQIQLDWPNEYIHRMSGYYKRVDGVTLITSLTFQSNIRTYGPFGEEGSLARTFFRTPLNIGMISGFYGRSDKFLYAIGAHFAPVYHKLPLKVIGPFGDDSRAPTDQWDDGQHSGIRQIKLTYGQVIDSIHCIYDDNGCAVKGSEYGTIRPLRPVSCLYFHFQRSTFVSICCRHFSCVLL